MSSANPFLHCLVCHDCVHAFNKKDAFGNVTCECKMCSPYPTQALDPRNTVFPSAMPTKETGRGPFSCTATPFPADHPSNRPDCMMSFERIAAFFEWKRTRS